jgi:hypothetical protein
VIEQEQEAEGASSASISASLSASPEGTTTPHEDAKTLSSAAIEALETTVAPTLPTVPIHDHRVSINTFILPPETEEEKQAKREMHRHSPDLSFISQVTHPLDRPKPDFEHISVETKDSFTAMALPKIPKKAIA